MTSAVNKRELFKPDIASAELFNAARTDKLFIRTRLTWLGWFVVIEAVVLTATIAMPIVQPKPFGLGLAIGLIIALIMALWFTPRALRHVQGQWILPRLAHVGDEVTVGASLTAQHGSPPVAVEAWHPQHRRFDIMARLTGLDALPTRPSWSTRFPKRGLNRLPPLTIRTSQPFGLVTASMQISDSAELIVLPAIGRVRKDLKTRINKWLETQSTYTDPGDDELARIRDYRPGDPPHRIHWKASARQRCLLVSERHAAGCRRIALVVDTTVGADGRKLERVITAAATLIDYFSQQNWTVTLYGHFAPHGIEDSRARLLETLALAGAENGDISALIPSNRSAIVLALSELAAPAFTTQKPLILTLSEVEALVWLPRRVR
jgi:uncharacterized protein (DUF58 family)